MEKNRARRIHTLSREQLVVLGYAKQTFMGANLDFRCFVSLNFGSDDCWTMAVISYKRHPREGFAATPVTIQILEDDRGRDAFKLDEPLVEGYLKALRWNSEVKPLMFQCETEDGESVYVGWDSSSPALLQVYAALEEALRFYVLLECKTWSSSAAVALKKAIAECAIKQLAATRTQANQAAYLRTRLI